MGKIRLRQATLRDLPVLVHQRRCMFQNMGHTDEKLLDAADKDYAIWVRKYKKRKEYVAFLAVDSVQGPVAGGAIWLRYAQPRPGFAGGKYPYLLSVYTEPPFRKRGLASKIVRTAIAWCKDHNYRGITLHASKDGQSMYEGLGWKQTKEFALVF